MSNELISVKKVFAEISLFLLLKLFSSCGFTTTLFKELLLTLVLMSNVLMDSMLSPKILNLTGSLNSDGNISIMSPFTENSPR